MVVYRHKIWLKNAQSFVGSKQFESFKLVGLFLGLFIIIFIFGLKISKTINKGIEAQNRTNQIANEVQTLEKENQGLKYRRDLYNSDTEIEAQYRELENKKKPGESVYIVSLPEKKKELDKVTQSPSEVSINSSNLSNWEKWVTKIFQ